MYTLKVENLSKRFESRRVFADLSFDLATGQSLSITGRNGSGKTTLLMLLLGVQHASQGRVSYLRDGEPMSDNAIRAGTALVSPYLNLYDQLTAEENLVFMATLSGINLPGKRIDELLSTVGLEGRGLDPVGAYSSGMKQRLKYAVALFKEPAYLFLDEPTSNLDTEGKAFVRRFVEDRKKESIVVIATNEKEDYSLTDELIRLGE